MKTAFLIFCACAFVAGTSYLPFAWAEGDGKKPAEMVLAGMFVPSGWMGDASDPACEGVLKISQDNKNPFVAGASDDRWEYRPTKGRVNWVAVAYQFPERNFGEKKGKNLHTGPAYKHLVFQARGRDGTEKVIFKALGGTSADAKFKATTDEISLAAVTLTKEWKQYTIDFGDHPDLSNVVASFTWATNADLCPDGAVFFIEGIKFTE